MSPRPSTGKMGKTRSPEALDKTLVDLTTRTVAAETAIREALTALRTGKSSYATDVLERYELARQHRADDRAAE